MRSPWDKHFRKAFQPGPSAPWRAQAHLAQLIETGLVAWRLVELPPPPSDPFMIRAYTGCSERHAVLCAQAASWAMQQEIPTTPGGYYGVSMRRADALALDASLYIEVGMTAASKAVWALEHGARFLAVPYVTPVSGLLLTPSATPLRRFYTSPEVYDRVVIPHHPNPLSEFTRRP